VAGHDLVIFELEPQSGSVELGLLVLTGTVGIGPLAVDDRTGVASREVLLPVPDARRERVVAPAALVVSRGRRRRAAFLPPGELNARRRGGALGEELVIAPVPAGTFMAVVFVEPDLRLVVGLDVVPVAH